MPAGSGERSKKGVERLLGAANGSLQGGGQGVTSRANGLQVCMFWRLRCQEWEERQPWDYSFSVGRMTATTKWAKWDAPSSSWSQRTTQ